MTDLDGNPRIFGAAVDLGPYENQDVTYTLTVIVVGQGVVTVEPDEVSYAYGTMVTLTAVADPGWTFAGWSGDLGGLNNPESLIMSGHKTVTATFSNNPPIADAGPDQAVEVNQTVVLDGSGSFDPDGHWPLSYGWTQTGGPPVELSDGAAVSPTFTAPAVGSILTFTLIVTDSYGLPSLPDQTTVIVQQPGIAISVQASAASASVGDAITYTYTLTNGGDLPLSEVNPVDDRFGPLFAAPLHLAAGETAAQTITYLVLEEDLPGPLINTVVVSGVTSWGNLVNDSDTAVVVLSGQPELTAALTAVPTLARPGEAIFYTLTLTNSGNLTLRDLAIAASLPVTFTLLDDLNPGAAVSLYASYTVLAADLPGPLTHTVTITATAANGLVMATTAVGVPLEPHTLYLPMMMRDSAALTLAHEGDSVVSERDVLRPHRLKRGGVR